MIVQIQRLLQEKDVLFEEALSNELFQVLLESPAVNDLVSLTVMIRAIFFCSEKRGIVSNWSQTPDSRLVLDGIEDLVDGESQQSEMMFRSESSEWDWREDWEPLSLEGKLPPVQVLGIGRGFVRRLRLSSIVTMFRNIIKESLHCLLQLNVGLIS